MTIEGAIRNLLLLDPAIVAIVGDRIYPQQLPEDTDTFPAITLWTVTDDPADENHEGSGGLFTCTVQVSAWARTSATQGGYTTARKLALAVREALLGKRVSLHHVEIQAITGGRMESVPPMIESDVWHFATDYDVIARVHG